MFKDFGGQWAPVLPARRLGRRPLPVELAGERLVLFRGRGGVGALLDRCPHRGAALSLGRVVEGCLECPFHGWRFREDGGCARVPFNPGARRERLGATALPVRELGGLIWVFSGPEARGEPAVPEALLDPGLTRFYYYEDWRCHWTRAMENMLDFPHLPYVHASTIGARIRRALRADSRLEQEILPSPEGFDVLVRFSDQPRLRLRWLRPNGMCLDTPHPPRLLLHVWCTPLGEERTRMILVSALRPGQSPLRWLSVRVMNLMILHQDRAVVESLRPREVPAPGQEPSVGTDRPTLRFRSFYFHELKGREAEPRAEPGPAERYEAEAPL